MCNCTLCQDKIDFLSDRLAVLLVVAKQRHGGSWNPWFRESTYDDEGSLGDEIREWPEYKGGLMIVENMLGRQQNGE